jgi:hypothetical protein
VKILNVKHMLCVKFMLKKQGIFPLSFLRNSLVCNFEDNRRLSSRVLAFIGKPDRGPKFVYTAKI